MDINFLRGEGYNSYKHALCKIDVLKRDTSSKSDSIERQIC
jgi:hypothetical protein